MRTLSIDIETYSEVDLGEGGVYRYANDPSFEILLLAYSYDGGSVEVIDLTAQALPAEVYADLTRPEVLKTAYNASFERTCLAAYFGRPMPAEQWDCTMVRALRRGLPASLAQAGDALGLSADQQKMKIGKALIRYFCIPCTPTKANGGRRRNMPEHDAEKWELFKEYCRRDVEVELAIRKKLGADLHPTFENELWVLDQEINDHGVQVDPDLIRSAIQLDLENTTRLQKEYQELTGLENAASLTELKKWLAKSTGRPVNSLTKDNMADWLRMTKGDAHRVLEIRQEMGKTSVTKYQAMARAKGNDNRVRGLLQFYGANRSGRWSGRLVQVQNLPQNKFPDLDLAREMVLHHDLEDIESVFGSPSIVLSQLIRTAFVPAEGHRFLVADFSAIEARVIAWLAGEQWRLDVFATHGKIYEASASAMFGVPIAQITKGSALRQKGKVSELALGYQGGPNALITMGALKNGLTEDELPDIVRQWRKASPEIVKFWKDAESAVKWVLDKGGKRQINKYLSVWHANDELLIWLPSGRPLVYQNPQLTGNKISYMGMNQMTKQWVEQETYGGKLVENIVQAVARDCLAVSMMNLAKAGYKIVMSIHDEVVIEATPDQTLEEACRIMGQPIEWAPGLLLRADGYECQYYRKD